MSAAIERVAMSTPEVRERLRKHYPSPEWALLEEVGARTGGGCRYADAVAIGLWQSRGHTVIGLEIKVSRSDWLRELKNPAKVEESVYAYCDRWMIVAPKGLIAPEEVPPTWGLLELTAAQIKLTVAPPTLTPKPLSRSFFAMLMRRGLEDLDRRAAASILADRERMNAEFEQRVAQGIKARRDELGEIQANRERVKAELGFDPLGERWMGPPIREMKVAMELMKMAGYGEDPAGVLLKMQKKLLEAENCIDEALRMLAPTQKDPSA